jgi:hypothetical protein
MAEELALSMREIAQARGFVEVETTDRRASFQIEVTANQVTLPPPVRAKFVVQCWGLVDDDDNGTYQEPPLNPYLVSWCESSYWIRRKSAAGDLAMVIRLFEEFMDSLPAHILREQRVEVVLGDPRNSLLRRLRLSEGRSIWALAEHSHADTVTVERWEAGQIPDRHQIERIAEFLRVETDGLELSFLEHDSNLSDDYLVKEDRLLAIGRDASRSLRMRLAALRRVMQTDVDPWPEDLEEIYRSILTDESIGILDRIRVSETLTAFGDPMVQERRSLYEAADALDELPPQVELRLASMIGGPAGLDRLLRLAGSGDFEVASEAQRRLGWMAHRNDEPPAVRQAAFTATLGGSVTVGHVFVSYVHADNAKVAKLVKELRSRGVPIWRDRDDLQPGQRWKFQISQAIREGNAFLALFSAESQKQDRSYMRQEILEAVEELRLRPADRAWFFPVLLSRCDIPELKIGPGETLRDLQYVPLYEARSANLQRLSDALRSAVL